MGGAWTTGARELLMNRSAPWLTVIMPTYRGEQWIDAALNSIATEAADGIEVVVIDSSPTSATLDIARKYAGGLDLHIVERSDLPMWTAKTNFGVGIAKSAHVCWLHQDDLWLPGRVAAVRGWIDTAPQASLHLAPSTIIDRDGRTLGAWRCPLPANRELRSDLVMQRLLVQNFVSVPAPVFRKDAWLSSGGLDEALWYTADWDIWLKLAGSGSIYYHDRVTTGFRIHGGSLTMTGSRDVADFTQQMQIVLKRHSLRLDGHPRDVERAACASIAVNIALASASAGDFSGLYRAATKVLRLGPTGIHRYLRDSRIVERLTPRVRAKLRDAF
jgi:glycosyltransferase involved in cell wall biosynthesis